MTSLRLRKRHRLRQKEIASIAQRIDGALGTRSFSEGDVVDMAEGPEDDVVFVNGKVLAFLPGGIPFLTVRGILRYGASKRYVTVDMGAVRFVCNGADVMGPGIVANDLDISVGDLVWIRDVQNQKPLAVGRALVSGETMARKEKGRAVESIHHVGDKLWQVDEITPKEQLATD
ncbi:MAG: PUA domain-containing protein [Thermoplasmata archaeon]